MYPQPTPINPLKTMSSYVQSIVWRCQKIDNTSELILMLAIADASDDSGEAMPTIDELAGKARMQPRSVYRILRRCKEKGFVKWDDTRLRDSPRNVYRINTTYLLGQENHPDPECTTLTDIQGATLTLSQGDGSNHPDPESGSYIVYNNTPSKEIDTKDGIGTLATASGSARAQKLTLVTDSFPQKPTSTAARKRFDPPSTESVKAYAAKNGLRDLAEPFIDYYEANGWVQGKAMKPLKSWEAAYRQWCRREVEFKKAAGHDVSGPVQPFGSGYKLQPFK